MKRRKFLKTAAAVSTGSKIYSHSQDVIAAETAPSKQLTRRPYGETGEYLSVIGFGGIMLNGVEQGTANNVVKYSVEAGVNYFDVAPAYGDAEIKLGPALEPYRKDVFLACKSGQRTAKEMTEELHRSLKRLRTDYFDLYQLHAMTSLEDVQSALGKGGAIEAIDKAKKEGLIRYVGFSSHSVETALELLENYPFDSVLAPVNFVMWYNGNFGPQFVEYAKSKGAAVLALKSMAFTTLKKDEKKWFPNVWYRPLAKEDEVLLGLRFTLSLPVTAAIPPGEEKLFRMAVKLASSFIPLSEKEKDKLKQIAAGVPPLFSYPSNEFSLINQPG